MVRVVPIVLAFLILAVSLGCANRRPASSLAARLPYTGFSTDRPPNDNWYINLSEAIQHPEAALYRRDVPNEAQSFGFFARFFDLGKEPRSDSEFSILLSQAPARGLSPEGATIRSYQTRPEPRQGRYCIRFTMKTVDKTSRKYPSRSFYSRASGLFCRHPDRPKAALVAAYVERGLVDQFDGSLAAEGEQLLRSLRIEVAH
jgi:hypothetical protein